MMYTVKAEYLDKWGDGMTIYTPVDENEISRLAAEWECDVADLMDQVVECNWYAVEMDEDDNDWGTGSYNYEETRAMAIRMGAKYIAEIEEGGDPVCVRVIEVEGVL